MQWLLMKCGTCAHGWVSQTPKVTHLTARITQTPAAGCATEPWLPQAAEHQGCFASGVLEKVMSSQHQEQGVQGL